MLEITEIQIAPIKPRNGLVGFANIVIENSIHLGSIGIHAKLDKSGYRITYPTKKVGERDLNIFYPINREMSKKIEEAIIKKAEQMFGEA